MSERISESGVQVLERSYANDEDEPLPLEYGAVPLDPWNVQYRDSNQSYAATSLQHIDEKLEKAIIKGIESDWVRSSDTAAALLQFMGASLHDSHRLRIERNGTFHDESIRPVDLIVPGYDERVERARVGRATPSELFEILVEYPEFGSIELAKLSHPLDFDATAEMDAAISEVIGAHDGKDLGFGLRYKCKRVDTDIPAAIVVRKHDVGTVAAKHGLIQIIERKSLLIRGDSEVCGDDVYRDRLIRNPDRLPELYDKVEGYLAAREEFYIPPEKMAWIQPTATSYYAKYI